MLLDPPLLLSLRAAAPAITAFLARCARLALLLLLLLQLLLLLCTNPNALTLTHAGLTEPEQTHTEHAWVSSDAAPTALSSACLSCCVRDALYTSVRASSNATAHCRQQHGTQHTANSDREQRTAAHAQHCHPKSTKRPCNTDNHRRQVARTVRRSQPRPPPSNSRIITQGHCHPSPCWARTLPSVSV